MREIGVFINEKARSNVKKRALVFAKSTESEARILDFPVRNIDGFKTLVVVGGDGTQKGVMEAAVNNPDTNFLVVPGGSENGLYRSASMSNAVTTPEKILSGDYSDLREFHPGEIDGEIFNHGVSFGKHAVNLEKYVRFFTGKVPREVHTMAAAIVEIGRSLASDDVSGTLVKLITTGSNLGRLKLFEGLDLFDSRLGYATVTGGTRSDVLIRSVAACYYMARRLPFPENIASWKIADSIDLDLSPEDQMMNADGQISKAKASKVKAERSKGSVNLAALKL